MLVHGRQRVPLQPAPNKHSRCLVSNKLPWLATFCVLSHHCQGIKCVLGLHGRSTLEADAWLPHSTPCTFLSSVLFVLYPVCGIAQSYGCNHVLVIKSLNLGVVLRTSNRQPPMTQFNRHSLWNLFHFLRQMLLLLCICFCSQKLSYCMTTICTYKLIKDKDLIFSPCFLQHPGGTPS